MSVFPRVSTLVQCTTAHNSSNGFRFPGHEGNFQERLTQTKAYIQGPVNVGTERKRGGNALCTHYQHTPLFTVRCCSAEIFSSKHLDSKRGEKKGGGYDKMVFANTHALVFIGGSPGRGGARRLWRGSITNCSAAFMYVWHELE